MVDIVLATFNGEKFLSAQISSIIAQTYKDWRLIIHDDGSCDNTLEIIRSFLRIDDRIILIEDGIINGSAMGNFMHTLKNSDSDFIMFCDQDDIWFDNKIEIMLDVMKSCNQDIPVVAYCQPYIWKPNNGIKGIEGLRRLDTQLKDFLFHNGGIHGCVSCFNRKAKEMMLKYKGSIAMHDHLLNLITITFGEVRPVFIPLQLYRQHENNVTGNSKNGVPLIRKIQIALKERNPVVCVKHYTAVKDFFAFYKNDIELENRQILHEYLKMPFRSKVCRFVSIIRFKYKRNGSLFLLLIKNIIHPYLG